jgi:hypothetical protein
MWSRAPRASNHKPVALNPYSGASPFPPAALVIELSLYDEWR